MRCCWSCRRGLSHPAGMAGAWRALANRIAAPALSGKASAGRWTPTRGQLPARRARRVPSPHLADQGAGGGPGSSWRSSPGGDQGLSRQSEGEPGIGWSSAIWWSTSAPARTPPVRSASPATPSSNLDGGGDIRHHTISPTPTATCPRMTRACRWPSPRWKAPSICAPPAPSARRGWTTPAAVGQGVPDHAFLLNNRILSLLMSRLWVQSAMGRLGDLGDGKLAMAVYQPALPAVLQRQLADRHTGSSGPTLPGLRRLLPGGPAIADSLNRPALGDPLVAAGAALSPPDPYRFIPAP